MNRSTLDRPSVVVIDQASPLMECCHVCSLIEVAQPHKRHIHYGYFSTIYDQMAEGNNRTDVVACGRLVIHLTLN